MSWRNWLPVTRGRLDTERRGAFVRGFAAAVSHRLNQDWVFQPISSNEELRRAMPTMMYRSRELAQNDSAMVKFLNMCVVNVVGQGIMLHVLGKDPGGNLDNDEDRKSVV